jgi:DNA repair exonuclease SbcCD ATPase subunit
MGATAARAGQKIDRVMDALRAVTRMLESFTDAATDLRRLRERLLRSRRARTRRGQTRSTVHERRETEKRSGRCRVCGSTSHRTPIHRRGQTDYV